MSDSLITYLNDHLGGAQIAVEVLSAMRDQHEDQTFREFAATLLREIQEDDRTLQSIAEKIAGDVSGFKKAGGWLLEKFTRLKLGHTGSTDFEMFESLELLGLGIHGKQCLWKALQAASTLDERLHGYDFEGLIQRAQRQYDEVESRRITLAKTIL